MLTRDERTDRAWVEVDLSALAANALRLDRHLEGDGKLMAVVKSDAYGHGIGPVVRTLAGRVSAFGVASIAEAEAVDRAVRLPDSGGEASGAAIVILGPVLRDEIERCLECGYQLSISTLEELEMTETVVRRFRGDARASVHLVVDTGMGRMGSLEEDFEALCRRAAGSECCEVAGLASHLPSADDDEVFTCGQLERFQALSAKVYPFFGPAQPVVHVYNSAGLLGYPPLRERPTLARVGLALYGVAPCPMWQNGLREVMQLKTRVRLVRDLGKGHGISYGRSFITPRAMRVATLGIGYADGFRRSLSGRDTDVLIGGRRCRLLGRVTMDQIMVDVSDIAGVKPGDEAVLFGGQAGAQLSIRELADKAGTIPWEIMTGISSRVERVYVDDSKAMARS